MDSPVFVEMSHHCFMEQSPKPIMIIHSWKKSKTILVESHPRTKRMGVEEAFRGAGRVLGPHGATSTLLSLYSQRSTSEARGMNIQNWWLNLGRGRLTSK